MYAENTHTRCISLLTSFLTVPLKSGPAANSFKGCSVFEILRLHVLKFKYLVHEGILYMKTYLKTSFVLTFYLFYLIFTTDNIVVSQMNVN